MLFLVYHRLMVVIDLCYAQSSAYLAWRHMSSRSGSGSVHLTTLWAVTIQAHLWDVQAWAGPCWPFQTSCACLCVAGVLRC